MHNLLLCGDFVRMIGYDAINPDVWMKEVKMMILSSTK